MDKNTAGVGLVAGAIGGLVTFTIISHAPSTVELDQVNDEQTTTTPIEESVLEDTSTTTTEMVVVSTPPTEPPIVVSIAPSGAIGPDDHATLQEHEARIDTLEATTTTSAPEATTTTVRPSATTTTLLYGDG
jgi:hypothetical protein